MQMKHRTSLLVALLMLLGGSANAQVVVQINGDQSFVIDEQSGLYFHNDTMRVDNATFALDDIQVITLRQAPVGIDEVAAAEMVIAPNPARDRVALNGIGSTPCRATLYSTAGIKLMEKTVADGSVLDISHLPEGLYILRCGDRTAKIVKQL